VTKWAAWATEPIAVVPPDPDWQTWGGRERVRLQALLAPWLVAPVEHVGSTAVPGLAAKPILDLQAAVTDLASAADIAGALAADGWNYVPPELDARPWRRFLVKVSAGRRVAHLHVLEPHQARWHDQLAFRDALRADPELLARYASLKATMSVMFADDRERYSAGKAEFIAAFIAAVLRARPRFGVGRCDLGAAQIAGLDEHAPVRERRGT